MPPLLDRLNDMLRRSSGTRARRYTRNALIALLLFGVIAWAGVPPLLQHVATHQLAAWLERPVSVGRVRFNPYTLRLDIEQLHIGERDGQQAFIDIDHLSVDAAWRSLVMRAAVIDGLQIDRPRIHVVRSGEQRFNFTDLIEKATAGPKSDQPARFGLHNIEIRDGSIDFDDRVLGKQHQIAGLQLGVPFIASLPSAATIHVQPLLQMTVDGSPFSLSGKTLPFSPTHDAVIDISLDRLDLTRYLGYVPVALPVKIPQGLLSTRLQLHFAQTQPQLTVGLSGSLTLDQLTVNDRNDAPLLALPHASLALQDVQPLAGVFHFGAINFDGLSSTFTLNADGSNNFQALSAPRDPAKTTPPATEKPQPPASRQPLPDLAIESLQLQNGAVHFADRRGKTPATLLIDQLQLKLQGLQTRGKTPAKFDLGLHVAEGQLDVKGQINAAARQAEVDIALQQLQLAALQPLLSPYLNGSIETGALNLQAKLALDAAGAKPNLRLQPSTVAVEQFQLRANREVPARWDHLQVNLESLDLSAASASITEVRAKGLNLLVHRLPNGDLTLAKLLRPQPAAPRTKTTKAASATDAAPQWQVAVHNIALDQAGVKLVDETTATPVKLDVMPLNLQLQDVSNDLSKPVKLSIDGSFRKKGQFKLAGSVVPSPLKADIQIDTQRLDVAGFEPYIPRLNVNLASAALSAHGRMRLNTIRDAVQVNYRGSAALGKLRMLDKLTDDDFLTWNNLNASGIDVTAGGPGPLKLKVGAVALDTFYARVILSAQGKLNLQDVLAREGAGPTSITSETDNGAAPTAAAPAPVAAAPSTPATNPAEIELGQITLSGGTIRYTDNFIKPNYTANVTDIAGKVGAFGTQSTTPADVLVQANFDHNAPIEISGSINPLVPLATVDVKAKADKVELTDLSSYSAKYAGFPLTKGKLSFDVRYQLDQGKLTADNHIYIDQLTFGDKVDSPDATKLPVRLAVSLLKDANGVIDLHVPISGSIDDPQFSLGGVILHAFTNIIIKAASSPFSLLSAAFGGGDQLSYVLFKPGTATLSADAQQKLETLIKILQNRPALKLDIIGRIDPEPDTPGLREAMVEERVRKQMLRDVVGKGESVDLDHFKVPPESYDKYLERAYKAEKFDKPRNFIGLEKSLPPDQMKKLLLTHMSVSEDDLRHLAEQRAEAVRKPLAAQIDPSRLFVVAPKLNADGIDDRNTTTRVDFALK